MPSFIHEPDVGSAVTHEPFFQTVRLMQGDLEIGRGRWHVGCNPDEGVVQLVELHIAPPHRRQGFGGLILREIYQQADAYFRSHDLRLRRMWTVAEHKGQVVARAFLTSHGFHHVSTVRELLKDQDLLGYVRAFD